jgi:hypothetical protein
MTETSITAPTITYEHANHAHEEEHLKDRNLRMMKSTVQKRSKKGPKTGVQSHKTP